jgi:hypothetical protein
MSSRPSRAAMAGSDGPAGLEITDDGRGPRERQLPQRPPCRVRCHSSLLVSRPNSSTRSAPVATARTDPMGVNRLGPSCLNCPLRSPNSRL